MTKFIIKILQHWCQIQKSRPNLAPKMFIHSKQHSFSASIFQFPYFIFSYKIYNPREKSLKLFSQCSTFTLGLITCQFSQSLHIFRVLFPFLQLSNIFTENLISWPHFHKILDPKRVIFFFSGWQYCHTLLPSSPLLLAPERSDS